VAPATRAIEATKKCTEGPADAIGERGTRKPWLTDSGNRLTAHLSDRYALERELGTGGMATVYLAEDVRHHRKVAIKVLHPELSAVLGPERFLKEIELTASLQHPHILPLFDSGSADGLLYYVMPYVEGETLRRRLEREQQLPIADALRIAGDVADALEYAHRRGIVHRDVKPENILLHEGRPLVADFGIALAVQQAGGARMTQTGMSLGTPQYMAPEQAMGDKQVDHRADIYALGAVTYEMLAGEPPFTGPNAQAIVARVMTEEPRTLRSQRRSVPPNVEAAVHTALAKLPADRFASAAAFAAALARSVFASSTGVLRVERPERRPSLRIPLQALPWVLLLAATAIAGHGWFREEPASVVQHRIALTALAAQPGSIGRYFAISRDGSRIAYVDSTGGTTRIYLKKRAELDPTPVPGTDGAANVAFSPDGEWIAFVAEGTLRKVPIAGGSPITIADSANAVVPAIAWLEGGTILYNDMGFNLHAVPENGGRWSRVLATDTMERGVVAITPLPRGRGALVTTCLFGCPESDVRAVDIAGGRARVLAEDVLKAWYTRNGDVVMVRRDGGVIAAPFDLRTLNFTGSAVPVLDGVRRQGPFVDMVLSANGTLLYATGQSQPGSSAEVVWVTRDGTATPAEPGWTFNPTSNWGLALSPDGRRLALSIRTGSQQDVWIKDLGGGPLTRVTFDGRSMRPRWIDDSLVAYLSIVPFRHSGVRARRADGTGDERTIFDFSRGIFEFVPANDGWAIARLGESPTRDIVLARVGDTTWHPLLASEKFHESAPTLSPDKRWLAYMSDESGRMEVFVRPFPDVNAGRWQISHAGGSEPLWARDGRELFFRTPAGTLTSVAVTTGAGFSASEPRPLFSVAGVYLGLETSRAYDISPDGSRFLFARLVRGQVDAEESSVVYVESWPAATRRSRRER
jgi:eukaryotic-like serine/threonine-protein kinase